MKNGNWVPFKKKYGDSAYDPHRDWLVWNYERFMCNYINQKRRKQKGSQFFPKTQRFDYK